MGIRLDELPVWFLRLAVIWFGLIWGSFLNVVIYRVPRDMSVVRPSSRCPGCGTPIAAWDNVPVLSYAILRGRARCCGAKMSPRYPMVELLGGMLSLAILEAVILRMPGSTEVVRAAAVYLADFALCMGLLAAAFIDIEHMFVPDGISLGGIVVGVATATLRGLSLKESLVGAVVGFLVVWFPLTFLYKLLRGKTGMGLGDAKLVALAGAWFGWPGAVFALFAGALQGTLWIALMWIFGVKAKLPEAVEADLANLRELAAQGDEEAKKELEADPLGEDEDDEPTPRIAFGPFLILATFELLFAGTFLQRWLGGFLFVD